VSDLPASYSRGMDSNPVDAFPEEQHLFIVERRLLGLTERSAAMLQNTLLLAAARFGPPDGSLRYLWSIFIPGQDRLVSLFAAASLDLVRAASDASLVPFLTIEPASFLAESGHAAV
jgi:hypothetical protein